MIQIRWSGIKVSGSGLFVLSLIVMVTACAASFIALVAGFTIIFISV